MSITDERVFWNNVNVPMRKKKVYFGMKIERWDWGDFLDIKEKDKHIVEKKVDVCCSIRLPLCFQFYN